VTAVAVSPDGRLVISGSDDRSVRVWELASGRLIHTLEGRTGLVKAVAVSPDGRLVIAGNDNTVRVWVLSSGDELARWLGDHPVSACAVVPTHPLTVAVGEAEGAIYALQLRGVPDAHKHSFEHKAPDEPRP
jgi:WD40 repeat protein